MRNFDLFRVPLRPRGQYLGLEVPGLAEGRPSLLLGDRVVATVAIQEEEEEEERGGGRYWEGFIHEIGKDYVLLKFAQELHQNSFLHNYDIIFQFSRTSFRRMHHSVEIAHLLGSKVLFPGKQTPKQPLIKLPSSSDCNHDNVGGVSVPCQFYNPVLNRRQQSAVRRILAAQNRPTPYVVFGPPGTGKTVTLVEAILQIHQRSRASRVLACAPSNSAADLIMERLLCSGLLGEGEIVRLNAIQRAEPPPSIAAFCEDTDNAHIAARCRVVVSTCMTAGFLHSLGLPVGHFSHVIVDEAGQATEPEALLSATLLSNTTGQVLAGDPHQLGPVLTSHHANSLGLSLSLMERVMSRGPYLRDPAKYSDHGSYDPLMVTKLVDNYRSHSSILNLYSDTFYHGELEPRADPSVTSLMCDWEGLPTKGFPLLFHGVMGEDMREGNSPSWFNPVEIIEVVSHVQSVIDNSTFAPKLSDIGIISPYRKQVERIRWFLGRVGVEGVKVGSVEEFQVKRDWSSSYLL
ncbi:RNA helicase Mov10l1 [Geodia barretti]|uniref:RNA helicase n=1 Tax=Geodia barretti TaxID=519541 RepID=A0AA35X4F4_GEOBA|nr:RNA helicase Mov10l1 [Geodia barretti]